MAAPQKEEVFHFTLKNPSETNSRKKNFLAKFPEGKKLDFTTWEQPVRMSSKISKDKNEVTVPNMALPKSIRRKQIERYIDKQKETKGKKEEKIWTISDSQQKQVYQGREQGQTARYGPDFKVYPIEEWFQFTAKKEYRKLTLEEAEAQLQSRNNKVNRWMMEKYKKEEEKPADIQEEEDKSHPIEEDEEEFAPVGDDENKKRRKRKPKKDEDGDGEEEEGEGEAEAEEGRAKAEEEEEEPDYEEVASDDEVEEANEEEEEEDPNKGFKDEASDEENTLTDAGKDIKSLLKKLEREADGKESSSEEEEEDGEKFDVNRLDMYKTSAVVKEESHMPSGEKRPLSGDSASQPATKKAKTEGKIDEEEVRKALLVLGKVKTKTLVSKFKSQLSDEHSKAKFAQLIKKLARIVEEHGEKYLVIKDEYKYKNT